LPSSARRFDEVLAHELRRAELGNSALALVLLDVDLFKKYNDRYGHPAGDACLQGVARVLATQTNRTRDLPARYGGEEFALILPDTDTAGALAVAQRIRAGIEAAGMAHEASPFGIVTASLGVAALLPGGAPDTAAAAALVARADCCLYRAKEAGRNQVASDAQATG
jgi:diguanylate cyclase (GGDEF)-like protein